MQRTKATPEVSGPGSNRPCMTSRAPRSGSRSTLRADPDNAGAGAYAYMDLMGLVSLGWMWLKMARAASDALASGGGKEGQDFYDAKLTTARFYAQRELPLSSALRRKIEAGAETLMKNSGRGLLGLFLRLHELQGILVSVTADLWVENRQVMVVAGPVQEMAFRGQLESRRRDLADDLPLCRSGEPWRCPPWSSRPSPRDRE